MGGSLVRIHLIRCDADRCEASPRSCAPRLRGRDAALVRAAVRDRPGVPGTRGFGRRRQGGVDVDVIASGLDNPRHVAVSPWGDVYVAESGRGGDHDTATSCFDSAEGFACTGATGAVTRITTHRWHSHQKRIVTDLASFAPDTGNNAIGPHGIFVKRGNVYVTTGGPTAPMRGGQVVLRDPTLVAEDPVSALYGKLLEVHKHGRVSEIADLWAFENENNQTRRSATRSSTATRWTCSPVAVGASTWPTPAATRC